MVSIFDENNDIEEDNVLMGKVIIKYFFIPYDAVSISVFKFQLPSKDFIHMIINYEWFTKLSLFHLQVVLPLLKIARAPETR